MIALTKPQLKFTSPTSAAVLLGTTSMTIEEVVEVARHGRRVAPMRPGSGHPEAEAAYERFQQSRAWVEKVLEHNDRAYYGINTGFGIKAGRTPLSHDDIRWLSRNLVVSHASSVGKFLHPEIVRAAMLIRANSLAQGYSGVRPELVNTLVLMLNHGVIPFVPEMGSVGSSGDLAPLSHVAQVLSQRPETDDPHKQFPPDMDPDYDESGQAFVLLHENESADFVRHTLRPKEILTIDGRQYALLSGAQAMELRGIRRLILTAKEGLGLNNGATFSTAIAVLALYDAENVVRHAEIAAAMSLESLLGFRDAYLPHVQQVRGQIGQIETAARLMQFLEGSTLADGHVNDDPITLPPQDAYSLRTVPQTIGAIWDTLKFVRQTLTIEINAATDNPMIFDLPEDHPLYLERPYKTISGGNFHGTPIGYVMDFLKIVMTDLGSMSERRIYRLINDKMNHGLPGMLIEEKAFGQTSGMMIPQYVASAVVSACKTLAHPDSVDSIPTSAGREDFVSMSMNAALHARQVTEKISQVIAIELLCGYLALKWRLKQLDTLLIDKPLHQYRDLPLENRTRVDDKLIYLHETGQRPQAGYGCQAAVDEIAAALYAPGHRLPDLGEEPTTIDRYTRPYIERVHELLNSQQLLERVYKAAQVG